MTTAQFLKNAGVLTFALAFLLACPSVNADEKSSKPRKPKKKLIVEEIFPKFPEGEWLNTKPLTEKYFKNKLTLVYFWDYTSINSIRESKPIQLWLEQYRPYGLQILWIHAPEFAVSGEKKHLEAVLRNWKISEPVFLDNEFKLWELLKVKSWPTKFLIDDEGKIIFSQIGEGRYSDLEDKMRAALIKHDPASVLPEKLFMQDTDHYNPDLCGEMSSETYLGYKRANWWGAKMANRQFADENETLDFKDRGEREEKGFFAEGKWSNREDYLEHARDTQELMDYIGLLYQGKEVYGVLHATDGKDARVYVTRDEMPVPVEFRGRDIQEDEDGETYFTAKDPRLYYLVINENNDTHELKLWTSAKGLAIHSFSFSNTCLSEFDHR
jgi:hypothetical protein